MSIPLGQEPSNTDGQVPTDPATTPPVTPAAGQEPAKSFDAAYVADLRKSEAATRKRAAELEARLKAVDDEKLSETERLAKKMAEAEQRAIEAETRLRESTLRIEVERQARRLNVVDEEAAYVLLDKSGIDIAADDFGKTVERRLKTLVESKPWLVPVISNGSAGPNPTPKNSGPPSRQQMEDDLYERMRQGAFPRL